MSHRNPQTVLYRVSCTHTRYIRGDIDAAAELTPALLVLNKLVLASEESRTAVKAAIFPPEADEVEGRACSQFTS